MTDRRDPLGLMEATDDANLDEVKAEIFANNEHRRTWEKINKALDAHADHVKFFLAQGLTLRNAKRSAAKKMGLTMAKVKSLIENREKIRSLLRMEGDDD